MVRLLGSGLGVEAMDWCSEDGKDTGRRKAFRAIGQPSPTDAATQRRSLMRAACDADHYK